MGKYVYAQSHPNAAWAWWQRIETELDSKLAAERRLRSVTKLVRDPHLYSDRPEAEFHRQVTTRLFATVARDSACGTPDRIGWFANRVGGMCPTMHAIASEIEASSFPEDVDDERGFTASKWPNGTHWYARLRDGTEVEINGRTKWSSREKAEAAAQKFINKRGKSSL